MYFHRERALPNLAASATAVCMSRARLSAYEAQRVSYLIGADQPRVPAGERFRALLRSDSILQMPGAYCGLAALQAKAQGFEAVYLSGAAISASMGLPDLGVITIEDVCFFIRQVSRAGGLPVLVDGDTGYGETLNVMYMVRSFEDAGAAAVHIEDQRLPKKCGHLQDKKLMSPREMAEKIAAAVRARRHLYIVARTDAAESEGLAGAIARAQLYVEAGADAIFPEALTSAEMFREFASHMRVPLLANMTEFGRTPYMSAAQFQALGYAMVIWPVTALRAAAKAHERVYGALKRDGGAWKVMKSLQTRQELYQTIGYAGYEALDASLASQRSASEGQRAPAAAPTASRAWPIEASPTK
jgi:methylisocitrate lyase